MVLQELKEDCDNDGENEEERAQISIAIIEMQPEVMAALTSMITNTQSHCVVNNTVVIQNGLTTNQVGLLPCLSR